MKRKRDHETSSSSRSASINTTPSTSPSPSPSKRLTRSGGGGEGSGHKFTRDTIVPVVCNEIVWDVIHNVPDNLQMYHIPLCCYSIRYCKQYHSADGMKHQKTSVIFSHEQELFEMAVQTGNTLDALEACRDLITYERFPTVQMLQFIIGSILKEPDNAEEHASIINQSVEIFNIILNTHPPCFENISSVYGLFLSSPLPDDEENKCSFFSSDNERAGIFEDLLSRITPSSIGRKKECVDDRKALDREMIVIDLFANLFEYDLAIWMKRYSGASLFIADTELPFRLLIVNFAFKRKNDNNISVTKTFGQILDIFIKLIKFDYPERYILTFSKLFDIVLRSYLMFDTERSCYFIHSDRIDPVVNAIFDAISAESVEFVVSFVEYLKPHYAQYIISERILCRMLSTNRSEIDRAIVAKKWVGFKRSKFGYGVPEVDARREFAEKLKNINGFDNFYETSPMMIDDYANFKSSVAKKSLLKDTSFNWSGKNVHLSDFVTVLYQRIKYLMKHHRVAEFRRKCFEKTAVLESGRRDSIRREERRLKNLDRKPDERCIDRCRENIDRVKELYKALLSLRRDHPDLDLVIENIDL